jgi:asparagine N-glycosylation enzyme membrane subunit Stt3
LAGFFTDWFWDGSFWILALAGLFCLLRAKGRMDEKFFFLSLLAFSFLAITPAFNFTNHYFVLMLPVVALLAAKAFGTAAEWLAAQPSALVRAAPWIVFGLVWGGAAWSNRGPFL